MQPSLTLREQLVSLAETYAAAKGLSLSRVSTIVMKGGHVFGRLAAAETDLTTTSYERALKWFAANWPADCVWPEHVARPQESKAA